MLFYAWLRPFDAVMEVKLWEVSSQDYLLWLVARLWIVYFPYSWFNCSLGPPMDNECVSNDEGNFPREDWFCSCCGVLQCLCDSVCKQSKSVTDIVITLVTKRTILFVRRSSIPNLSIYGQKSVMFSMWWVGYLFLPTIIAQCLL